jgi:hypothetical protein
MESIQLAEQSHQILENAEIDDKMRLLLSIIFNLEKRLSAIENKMELMQQEKLNQYLQCSYCQKHKNDVRCKSFNNKNNVISCDDCYSKIFFSGTSFSH